MENNVEIKIKTLNQPMTADNVAREEGRGPETKEEMKQKAENKSKKPKLDLFPYKALDIEISDIADKNTMDVKICNHAIDLVNIGNETETDPLMSFHPKRCPRTKDLSNDGQSIYNEQDCSRDSILESYNTNRNQAPQEPPKANSANQEIQLDTKAQKEASNELIDAFDIGPVDNGPLEQYKNLTFVCAECGVLVGQEHSSLHTPSNKAFRLISRAEARGYVLDEDLEFFKANPKGFKKFIDERITAVKGSIGCLEGALRQHLDLCENIERYYKSDLNLVEMLRSGISEIYPPTRSTRRYPESFLSIRNLYNGIGTDGGPAGPAMPITRTGINNFKLLVGLLLKNEARDKPSNQFVKSKLPKCVPEHEIMEAEYLRIRHSKESGIPTKEVEEIQKSLNKARHRLECLKENRRYIKLSEELVDNGYVEGYEELLSSFALVILKYSAQIEGADVGNNMMDSGGKYQLFYGARYMDNVVSAHFDNGEYSSGPHKSSDLPICLSRAFDSHLSLMTKESVTVGGSADGYVAIYDNGRSKALYVTNLLTGDSAIVAGNCNWTQPMFWKNKIILFTTWEESIMVLDKNKFMEEPGYEHADLVRKEKLLTLADNSDFPFTGKFSYASPSGTLKIFDAEIMDLVEGTELTNCFTPTIVYGKEKLFTSHEHYERFKKVHFSASPMPLFSSTNGIWINNRNGPPTEVRKTGDTTSTVILSDKHPEDLSKALAFGWGKVFCGDKQSPKLCGIPIKPINMFLRFYDDAYLMLNSNHGKWEFRRIMFLDK